MKPLPLRRWRSSIEHTRARGRVTRARSLITIGWLIVFGMISVGCGARLKSWMRGVVEGCSRGAVAAGVGTPEVDALPSRRLGGETCAPTPTLPLPESSPDHENDDEDEVQGSCGE